MIFRHPLLRLLSKKILSNFPWHCWNLLWKIKSEWKKIICCIFFHYKQMNRKQLTLNQPRRKQQQQISPINNKTSCSQDLEKFPLKRAFSFFFGNESWTTDLHLKFNFNCNKQICTHTHTLTLYHKNSVFVKLNTENLNAHPKSRLKNTHSMNKKSGSNNNNNTKRN